MMTGSGKQSQGKLDQVVAQAREARKSRESTYRERALNLFPHVCGRCGREFSGKKLKELTVHHRNHNHDDNPPDGSNWELLCVYCHDNEHQRLEEASAQGGGTITDEGSHSASDHKPFADLAALLKAKQESS
jgi:5-methylcytosine-specific restriction endonuclease McrA